MEQSANQQINLAQQVFILFYAIAWGTAANSQPRWGAFSYAAIEGTERRKPLLRIIFSWLFLNIAPICFFVWMLGILNEDSWQKLTMYPWSFSVFWRLVFTIISAFAPFGFYKFWMGIVQFGSNHCFTSNEIIEFNKKSQNPFGGSLINILSGLLIILLSGFLICVISQS